MTQTILITMTIGSPPQIPSTQKALEGIFMRLPHLLAKQCF
jgi:hypothetical protein